MKIVNRNNIKHILVIRTDRMGDVLLNIPAIRALKASFNAFIVILVNPAVKELLAGTPEIDQIWPFDEKKWNKSLPTRLKLLLQIRKMNFDLVVILNPAKRFHILAYLAGIPRRLGYDRKWGFLLTHKIEDKKYLGQKHEVEYNLDLVRSIGADTSDLRLSINVEEKDIRFVRDLLFQNGVSGDELVVAIHPYASNPAKCWPAKNFAYVADEVYARFSAKVIIIGGKEECNSAIKLVSLTKEPTINLSGRLSLRQLAALFKRCRLLISNDSGPVHIASAMGTSCIVIFGRNLPGVGPKRWGPWGAGHIVLHKDPGCSPCLDRKCPYAFKCLSSITPEEVIEAVENSLANSIQLKAHENTNS